MKSDRHFQGKMGFSKNVLVALVVVCCFGVAAGSPFDHYSSGSTQDCDKVRQWIDSIRQEASRTSGSSGAVNMDTIYMEKIREFAVPGFVRLWGMSLKDMSIGDRERLADSVRACSRDSWAQMALAQPLRQPPNSPQVKQWIALFDRAAEQATRTGRQAARDLDARMQERLDARARRPRVPQTTSSPLSVKPGDIILENDDYRLVADNLVLSINRLSIGRHAMNDWCFPGQYAFVRLVFKKGENFQVRNDEAYWRVVENEIYPAVSRACAPNLDVSISNHIAGITIENPSHDVYANNYIITPTPQDENWLGSALSEAIYSRASMQRRSFTPGVGTSVAAVRSAPKVTIAQAQAEIERKETADRLDRSRPMAADVLRLVKRNAPRSFSFAGYQNSQVLANIYTGNFKPYSAGYDEDPTNRLLLQMAQNIFNPAQALIAIGELSRIATIRGPVDIAHFTYQRVYGSVCRTNREMPWEKAQITVTNTSYEVRSRWGLVQSKRETGRTTDVYTYDVRRPFYNSFLKTWSVNSNQGIDAVFTQMRQNIAASYETDFRRFLRTAGCSSPATRQLEVNLHLFASWLPSVQEFGSL